MTTPSRASMDGIRRAIESSDAAVLAAFYAPDAVLRVVDRLNPPSRPREFRGQRAIAAFYEDVCGRAMTHRIDAALQDGDRIAFTEECQYPDGIKVICASVIETSGGRITRQTNVQAWDE